ncbi:glycine--tRNA ligase subunit beta [Granulosicoccaceae sp. 1_MG-2023]|nr:glycine--tRNA ligase subunit beta [Granulosicoccaceae sp. 1_MG-2023]
MADQKDLLVELGCEELPAGSVLPLAESLGKLLSDALKAEAFEPGEVSVYATPRRIAALIRNVRGMQPDREIERRGPAVNAAFDDAGNPKPAATGFAKSVGVEVADLERLKTDKGEWLYYKLQQKGEALSAKLPAMLDKVFADMPMPKRMRWADLDTEFLRPVHWLLVMHGDTTLPGEALGLPFGNETRGHRFHAPQPFAINNAGSYVAQLLEQGHVVADFAERRARVVEEVTKAAAGFGGNAVMDDGLIDEVTALVEWPVAIAGSFEEEYLAVPKEALIQTMQENQRYFPLLADDGSLLAGFITISNIVSSDPQKVREGNERVVRPRLADAMFFWTQDQKKTLESHLESLKTVVFQQKLGTLYDKTLRLEILAGTIAEAIGADVQQCKRAARLSKCDLMTEMVYEFAAMQGIAGRYYSALEGEAAEVSQALEDQYLPKHAGDATPSGEVGRVLALADKLDTLAGIIGIGQMPSGTKDPFALRRTSLGLLRIMIENEMDLDLAVLLDAARQALGDKLEKPERVDDALPYVLDRLPGYYADQGVPADVVDAVMASGTTRPLDFDRRVKAVAAFRELPEAQALAGANKRIRNILKKAGDDLPADVDAGLLSEEAEKHLAVVVAEAGAGAAALFEQGDYAAGLKELAVLRAPVDDFFEHVMVMAEDEAVRRNRQALLAQVAGHCSAVADIARLNLES